jgi:CheY-like chemotaxis protein
MTTSAWIVVVVHADAAVRALLTALLGSHEGWSVQGVPNGGEAVRAALIAPPQLMLLDPHLHGMDGSATIAALRAHGISCPVVALVDRDDEARGAWEQRGYIGAMALSGGLPHIISQLRALLNAARV